MRANPFIRLHLLGVAPVLLGFATIAFSGQTAFSVESEEPDFEAAASRIIIARYSTANPVYQHAWQFIESSRADVLREIYRLTGLALPKDKVVRVLFVNNLSDTPRAITYAVSYAEKYGARMQYSIPAVISRQQNPIHLLQHEMTHALQQAIMGHDAYWKLPVWIHEGLATYAGGHGPERLQRFRRLGTKLITGLEKHKGPSDYAEDYLAFVFIEKRWGGDALKAFVSDLTYQRTPWKDAVRELSGMDWPQFSEAAQRFSIKFIENAPSHRCEGSGN